MFLKSSNSYHQIEVISMSQINQIDLLKLKKEINHLAEYLKSLKKLHRDPELNQIISHSVSVEGGDIKVREWDATHREQYRLGARFTKLCTLRALMRGKIHFSPHTRIESHCWEYSGFSYPNPSPSFSGISREDLRKWVHDAIKEFSLISA